MQPAAAVRGPLSAGSGRQLHDIALPISDVPRAIRNEDLGALLERLGPDLNKRVLVFDAEQLVGILSPADVARQVTTRQTPGRIPALIHRISPPHSGRLGS